MAVVSPAGLSPTEVHQLDPAKIIEAAENLARRVNDRFPESHLASLAVKLAEIARVTNERARQAARPIYSIRLACLAAVCVCLLGLFNLTRHVHPRWEFSTIGELFEAADAGFNLVVVVTGAIWFLITFETRVKRKKALAFIGELCEFIHVIDLTQLYFTPEIYKADTEASQAPSRFDYTYLLFCTQMLAVIRNLALIYTRDVSSDSIWRAAIDVEMLAVAVEAKLFSKAETARHIEATS